MPHVIVKLFPGRSDQQKQRLADEIVKAVIAALNSEEKSISVAVEDVEPAEWTEKVYNPDIRDNMARIYKQPGYTPD
ncbi:tautomerase family protein [Ancylobacter sp. Lp-2]|uniref:tautomerase family protein n=1 Tax=Ancylobacter sp. Lp-2 TaxID=2881339 RepID=UPI001E2FF94C|nr:tautomerase family protein [Ancylobacter sp. Lp-2]MCB4770361.1 tautomerase family protein [Ancylobacter sp. Lp-2]